MYIYVIFIQFNFVLNTFTIIYVTNICSFFFFSKVDTMSKQIINNISHQLGVLHKGICPKIYVPLVINTVVVTSHPPA